MNEAKECVIAERTLTITPVRVGDLPAFIAAIEPMARELSTGDLLGALSRHADALILATALGAGVERAWLEERTADDLVRLASAVVEVNADFFVRRLVPAIEQAAQQLTSLTDSGGTTG